MSRQPEGLFRGREESFGDPEKSPSRSSRDGANLFFTRPLIQITLKLYPPMRPVAKRLVIRVPATAEPDLIFLDLNLPAPLRRDREITFDVIRTVIPRGDDCRRHIHLLRID
jgi:hypothetical protein